MSEFLQEPELTRVIQDIQNRMLDVHYYLESTPEGVKWRNPPEERYGGLRPDPVPKSVWDREMTDRDREIIASDGEGYEYIQIIYSRMSPNNGGMERVTLKTAHLPIEAVKNYIRRRHVKGD